MVKLVVCIHASTGQFILFAMCIRIDMHFDNAVRVVLHEL